MYLPSSQLSMYKFHTTIFSSVLFYISCEDDKFWGKQLRISVFRQCPSKQSPYVIQRIPALIMVISEPSKIFPLYFIKMGNSNKPVFLLLHPVLNKCLLQFSYFRQFEQKSGVVQLVGNFCAQPRRTLQLELIHE